MKNCKPPRGCGGEMRLPMERRVCKTVYVGQVPVGGGAPVTVQSMLNTPAHDIPASVEQARRLQAAGCDIIRAAVPDREAVPLIAALKEAVSIPVVADIHFDYRLALEAAAAGVDKIRINPGTRAGSRRWPMPAGSGGCPSVSG